MMADNMYVPQVDYTSRDYASISNDLKALIPNFAPQWTSRDSSDFGIVLIELFAYMGDLLNYYIDRAANESFITTATQRETVLRLAQLLNYTPNGINPSTGTVTFTNISTSPVTISKGTRLATTSDGANTSILFEVSDTSVTVPAASGAVYGTVSANVIQGVTVAAETLGTSSGTAYQSFKLANSGVLLGQPMTIVVNNVTYSKVPYTIDYNAEDPVFSAYTDGNGNTYIKFGDGVSGKIPPFGGSVKITYRYTTTAGSLGNVATDTIKTVVSDANGLAINDIRVTNAAAFSGGTDAESTDSVRVNAPLALRSLNRAVSLKDYAQLAVQVNGVSKAIASASVYTSVTIYIAASGGAASSSTLKTDVKNYFTDKVPPNTSLQVLDFTPVYPYLDITVNVMPTYDATVVKNAVTSALYSLFIFDYVIFNDLIAIGDIHAACRTIAGVAYVTLNDYEKQYTIATSPTLVTGVTDLSCNIDEVPILEKTYIKVATTGGIS
jgi:hypothetical protein